jgi:hypothetical protein
MAAITDLNIAALADRVKNILMQPAAEWDKIAAEPATLPDLLTRYVAILAAIPALCGFVGLLLSHAAFSFALGYAVMGYVMSFIMVGVSAFIIEYLAPQFDGKAERINAFKLSTYAMTAYWVTGVFALLPSLGKVLGLLGLYSVYLLYLGIPKLAKVPAEKAGTFTAVIFIASAIIGSIFAVILTRT